MISIYEYWNSLCINMRKKLKSIISIILYLFIYFLVPPNFPFPISFLVQLFFSVISIGIILVLYFLPSYSNKRILFILTARALALLYLFFSLRLIFIETTSTQLRIDNTILSLFYIPLLFLLSVQSFNKFLITQEDYKIKVLILSSIQEFNKEISLWQLKPKINNIPRDRLSNDYKDLILKNLSNILTELKEEKFINGFTTISITKEGRDLRNYFS